MEDFLKDLYLRLPEIDGSCRDEISNAVSRMEDIYKKGNKILVCGNGGSAADSEHIVAELMKGFLLKRKLVPELCEKLKNCPSEVTDQLQMGIPAISLVGNIGLQTAFSNDVCYELVFAQQVLNLGKSGDGLLCLSTSGNSPNIISAIQVAKALDLNTIGLTGSSGGKMRGLVDILICAPETSTPRIQEYHLAIYHALCAELEFRLFGGK